MRFFKNRENKVFAVEDDVDENILNQLIMKHNLQSITLAEYENITAPKFEELVLLKINDLKRIYIEQSNANITYKNVIYKGGESSASAIAGAVNLAKSLNESDVTIIDFEDKSNTLSFEEALELSSLLAKSWRESFFKYKELKRQVSIVTTIEELEQIKW